LHNEELHTHQTLLRLLYQGGWDGWGMYVCQIWEMHTKFWLDSPQKETIWKTKV
jgi:hypothetical protein